MTMKKNSGVAAVLWWIGWISLTVVSFFVSCYFWTHMIARHVGTMDKPGVPILWVAAVFGSWMVLLVPLIILMYGKVDKAYEDVRIARQTRDLEKAKTEFRVRCVQVDDKDRLLKKDLSVKLKGVPEAVKRGHLLTATLKNGRKVPHVFVMDKKDVLGVYGVERLDFDIRDIVDVEPADLDRLPDFKAEQWLRLDGVGTAGLP